MESINSSIQLQRAIIFRHLNTNSKCMSKDHVFRQFEAGQLSTSGKKCAITGFASKELAKMSFLRAWQGSLSVGRISILDEST